MIQRTSDEQCLEASGMSIHMDSKIRGNQEETQPPIDLPIEYIDLVESLLID